MKNKLRNLIHSYSANVMSREFKGIGSFEMAVTCKYADKNGRLLCCNHQRRVRRDALEEILKILTQLMAELVVAKDFEALYKIILSAKVANIGQLTIYDIAMHIGYWLSPKILPKDMVYIHAGAEIGAMALYKKGLLRTKPTRIMSVKDFEFLSELMNLNKAEHGILDDFTFAMLIEDFLCSKHKELAL